MKKTFVIALVCASAALAQQGINGARYHVPATTTQGSYDARQYTNEAGTGTTNFKLAKLTGDPVTAIKAGTGDTAVDLWIVGAGGGTTGLAQLVYSGQVPCTFDGNTTVNDWVAVSTTVAGDCHDTGSTTRPTSGRIIGTVHDTAAGGSGQVVVVDVDVNIVGVPAASGDFSSNTSTSVDSEVVLFSGTGGKTGKRSTGSGIAKLTSGVLSVIDFPNIMYSPAANCVNAVAGAGWSTGATPASLCRAGTNNKDGLLSPWGASDVAYFKVHIPKDADTSGSFDISIDLTSTDATNGHTVIMQAATAFAKGDGTTTDDVAFNTAQSFGTITLNGNANRTWTATLTGLTTTGIAAPGIMWIKISRTTDTATNVGVYGATVDVPRLVTVQAN